MFPADPKRGFCQSEKTAKLINAIFGNSSQHRHFGEKNWNTKFRYCRRIRGGYKMKTEDGWLKNEDPCKIVLNSLENWSNMILPWSRSGERSMIFAVFSEFGQGLRFVQNPTKSTKRRPSENRLEIAWKQVSTVVHLSRKMWFTVFVSQWTKLMHSGDLGRKVFRAGFVSPPFCFFYSIISWIFLETARMPALKPTIFYGYYGFCFELIDLQSKICFFFKD